MFTGILICIFGVQILIVQFTREVFQVAIPGIAWFHWLLCLALGLTVWPIDLLIKYVPDRICPEFGKKKKAIKNEGMINTLRRKRTQSLSVRGGKENNEPGSKQGSNVAA